MRKKRRAAPALTLLAALTASLGGCDTDPGEQATQRDVYTGPNAFENCVADWGNEALCQQRLTEEEKKKYAQQSGGGGGGSHVFIYGPGYMGADRTVTHNGNQYTPTATRADRTAMFDRNYRPTSFTAPRPAGVSTSTSRGGFGAAGRGGSSAS